MTGLYYPQLLDVLRAAGVAVAESATTAGWQTRARSSGGFPSTPLAVMWHHTASSTTPASDLSWMIDGCPDAPVGNMLLDRTGTVWPVAAGAANTAGKGGPSTFSRGTVPADQGNTRIWSVEAQNDGVGEAWPTVQLDAYFTASNALSAMFGNLPADIIGHAHYTFDSGGGYRKIDPATSDAAAGPWWPGSINTSGTWNLDDMRDEATRRAATVPTPTPPTPTPTPEDDDMAATFIISNTGNGQVALVYGDGRLTGLAGADLAAYIARFGEPIPTDPVVFDDMAGKG